MPVKRKVRAKFSSAADPDEVARLRAQIAELKGKDPHKGWPWWKLADHTNEDFARYYALTERTIYRLKAAGVDLTDVRQVLEHMAESARASRGPLRARLMQWNDVHGSRIANRQKVLGNAPGLRQRRFDCARG